MSLDLVGRLNEPRSGRMVKLAHRTRARQGPNESLRMGAGPKWAQQAQMNPLAASQPASSQPASSQAASSQAASSQPAIQPAGSQPASQPAASLPASQPAGMLAVGCHYVITRHGHGMPFDANAMACFGMPNVIFNLQLIRSIRLCTWFDRLKIITYNHRV